MNQPGVARPITILWIRNDLRIHDNPALAWATEQKSSIVAVYIEDESESPSIGAASRAWLKASLLEFQKSLHQLKIPLLFYCGDTISIFEHLQHKYTPHTIVYNRSVEPEKRRTEVRLERAVQCTILSCKPNLLLDPFDSNLLYTKNKKPFTVFTPFWKRSIELLGTTLFPLCMPKQALELSSTPPIEPLPSDFSIELPPITLSWEQKILHHWQPGEQGALLAFKKFRSTLSSYGHKRDFPADQGTSLLSPHLHFGEISPRYIWNSIPYTHSSEAFLRELGWREFANYLLYHYPHTVTTPLREEFKKFPWLEDQEKLKRWQKGETGIPIVDAGMRQLWETGWMHNRLRMIVGSFLVKHLLQPWQKGAEWFWNTLVDADLANNTFGWQWVAGCGADAAPYFRIFNPVLQSEKFDAEGCYIRKYVPELGSLPAKMIHAPWLFSVSELRKYNVELGITYPQPICDLAEGRKRALAAFASL